jgi:hypothetical protein
MFLKNFLKLLKPAECNIKAALEFVLNIDGFEKLWNSIQ